MTKDVFDAMRDSHSVRQFKRQSIPEATVTRILEAACWAPSAGNLQPWCFYVIYNQDKKRELASVCYHQEQIVQAPVVIAVFCNPSVSRERYGERGENLYCIQDTSAAAENMLIAAEGLGINSCWVGAFDERRVQSICEASEELKAMAIICLGYSDEKPHPKERYSMRDVAKFIH